MAGLVEKIWFENHPLGYFGAPLLWPLSRIFSLIARYRRRQFLQSPQIAYRAPVPVIVVGNITAGGNGKTPLVLWIVSQLKAHGFNPGVVSRGYGGQSKVYPVVLNDQSRPDQVGDEPVLIHQRTQCPVAVSPNRQQAIESLLPLGIDIIVTDDGLQHYKMARDLEFVVVDGERRFGNQHFIPMGPLREGLDRLASVDRVICNGGKAEVNELKMTLKPSYFVNVRTGETCQPAQLFEPIAMAGIGNPTRFFQTLMQLGVQPSQCHSFADHFAFDLEMLLALARPDQSLVMTEKDAVKCRCLLENNQEIQNWWYLPVDAHFEDAAQTELLNLMTALKEK